MVWAHESVKHSHFKNPRGQDLHALAVADPAPTGRWTKTFEPKDYVWA